MTSLAEDVSTESSSEKDKSILDKIVEDAMISNEHTSKWRVFTDSGRDYFMQVSVSDTIHLFFLSMPVPKNFLLIVVSCPPGKDKAS